MANTIPSINLTGIDWQNLNTLSGIAVGSSFTIQNQSSDPVQLAISPTKPPINFNGIILPVDPATLALISAGEDIVWAVGSGPINLQVK